MPIVAPSAPRAATARARRLVLPVALAGAAALVPWRDAAAQARPAATAAPPAADTTVAAVQARGAAVMGVDQTTSRHVFETLPDGGRIVLRRDDATDTAAVRTIRAHLRAVAAAFARGDFADPRRVHGREVPGTAVMAARRAAIAYAVADRPDGAEVRIRTVDPEAVAAVHAFLAFQRDDHRAAGHEGHDARAGHGAPAGHDAHAGHGAPAGAPASAASSPPAAGDACPYDRCALSIAPVWHGLALVEGTAGRRVATLGFFRVRPLDDVLAGRDSAAWYGARAVRVRRAAAVLTDVGGLLLGYALVRRVGAGAFARDARVAAVVGVTAGAVSVPLHFVADGHLSRAVWWHNRQFAR